MDSTPIEPGQRFLRSPFNGELWPVPPEVTPDMYAELVKRGFAETQPKPKKAATR